MRLLMAPEPEEVTWWDGKNLDEVAYCEELLARQEMKCINKRIFSMNGLIEDEFIKNKIAEEIKPYVRRYLVKTTERILDTLKVLCTSDSIPPTPDRVHLGNGTYHLKTGFTKEKEWTMNRLPVDYDPEAPKPERWIRFMTELLYEEDIPTLQEFLGY